MTDLSLPERLRSLFITTGLPDVMGGIAAFDAGIEELKVGLLAVATDLIRADRLEVDLADAVLDPVRFPHAAEMHGTIGDLLKMRVPSEVESWAWKVARATPPPDVPEISRAIASLAVAATNPFHRALGRFGLFELICLRQRLLLRRDGVHLELINGRRRDIEVIAAAEVEAACALAASGPELLALEDPVATIEKMASLALFRYVDVLRRELAELNRVMYEQLERRKRILAAAARVEPGDAVLILNQAADEFGEERLAAVQLQRMHPLLLAGLTDDAIYKRVERLPDKVVKRTGTAVRSFGDIMVAIMSEVEP